MMPDCSWGRVITRAWGSCGVMSPKGIEPFSGMSPTTSSVSIARIESAAGSIRAMDTDDVVGDIPLKGSIPFGDITPQLPQARVITLPHEQSGIIDQNDVAAGMAGENSVQFREHRALGVAPGRVFTAIMAVQPEQGWLTQLRDDVREQLAGISLDDPDVSVRGETRLSTGGKSR